jgi:hypothetical protein
MFQSSISRLHAWLGRFDDILGDPPAAAPPHPHRRELRWERDRRPGTVVPRPAHCLSPVRAGVVAREQHRATR